MKAETLDKISDIYYEHRERIIQNYIRMNGCSYEKAQMEVNKVWQIQNEMYAFTIPIPY